MQWVIQNLINLLPNATILPEGFINAWEFMGGFVANMYYEVPAVGTLLLILSFVIILEGSIFAWKQIKLIIAWMRGSGT